MRSPATLLLLISFIFIKFARSQSNELIIFGQTGKLYLEHTVVAKDNWYSVGRLYNMSPKELAPFNHLALTQPLAIGQILQIPLTAVNFSQTMQKAPTETLIPVIYVTQEKEWMYRISVNHNKVPIPTLEKWNNMNKDAVRPGMHLIVGYLKVKTALSALATGNGASATAAGTPPAAATPPVSATSPPATTTTAAAKPVATPPAVTKPAASATTDSPVTARSAATISTATKPAPPATTSKPATSPATLPATTSKPATPPATLTSSAATATTPAGNPPASTSSAGAPPVPHFDGGVFKGDFLDNGKSASGAAGIFKSTSGWQDGKYYALMNNVSIGSIVKVTDPALGKSIFVKVLGQLPDMKESVGLTIRISNAAAAEMGETGERFTVQVNY